jgi:CheY-like chemotaxis protein
MGDNESRLVADNVRRSENLSFTKIIAMSSKLTDGQALSLRSQGFDHFLKKPFQVRQVVEAIETATNLVA